MTSVNAEVTSNLIPQSGRSVAAQRNEGGDANVTATPSGVETRASPPAPSGEGTSSNTNNNTENSASGGRMPVTRICRDCAFEVFLHELYPWWARERKKVLDAAEAEEAVAAALTASSSSRDESQSTEESDGPDDVDDDEEDEDGESVGPGGAGGRTAYPTGPKIPSWVGARSDCPEGRYCPQQKELCEYHIDCPMVSYSLIGMPLCLNSAHKGM